MTPGRHPAKTTLPFDPSTSRYPAIAAAVILVLSLGAGIAFTPAGHAQTGLASLDGTVTDLGGNAITDAHVVLKKQVEGSLWHYHETGTDAAGDYSFSGLEPGTWNLSVQKEDYRPHHESIEVGLNGSQTHPVTLRATSESKLSGTVHDADDGAPLEGAKVQVESWQQNGSIKRNTTTDAEGAFQIMLFAGENQITISKSGYGIQHDWIHHLRGDIDRDYRLWDMPPQDAQVQGRVVDAETGQGVQAYITIRPDWQRNQQASGSGTDDSGFYPMPPRHSNNYNNTITDEDGRFTMQAYPGYVVVEANRADHLVASTSLELTRNGSQQVTLELERLPERSVTLSGVVTNAENGSAIEGASINVQVADAGDWASTQSDENGQWELTVRPGYTLIRVSHWGAPAYATMDHRSAQAPSSEDRSEPAQSGSDQPMPAVEPAMPHPEPQGPGYHPRVHTLETQADSRHDVDLQLQPKREPTTTIVGYVVDQETNEAIADATVHLQNHDTGDWGRAVTDENGSYRFQTHAGYHSLSVHTPGYLPAEVNTNAPESGTHRVDLMVKAGEYAQQGWWHPNDRDGDDRPYPMPMPESAPAMDPADGDAARTSAMSEGAMMDAAEGFGGEGNLRGSGGGLGPYDANAVDDQEAPAPGVVMIVLIVLAALVARKRPLRR